MVASPPATGGMGRECRKFYSRLSEIISDKKTFHIEWQHDGFKRKISFSLMRSIGVCLW